MLNQASLLQTSTSTTKTFTVLLGAVAAISPARRRHRRHEHHARLGDRADPRDRVRLAIGARARDILTQFLVEAVLLSVLGGLAGVVAGLIGSHFKIVGVEPVIAPYSIALAFGVAALAGLFFGIYPANRAASLRPIDALRFE